MLPLCSTFHHAAVAALAGGILGAALIFPGAAFAADPAVSATDFAGAAPIVIAIIDDHSGGGAQGALDGSTARKSKPCSS